MGLMVKVPLVANLQRLFLEADLLLFQLGFGLRMTLVKSCLLQLPLLLLDRKFLGFGAG